MSEEYKSKYATDVKKLRFNGLLDRAFFGESVVKEAWRMIYNNEVVFNRAFFELWSKNTIELEAEGTREKPLYKVLDVVSRKKDYDGLITEVVFEGADEVIEPNTTDKEKSGTFTIRQRYSNLEIVGTWTQKKDEVKEIEYQYIDSVDVDYDGELPATLSLVNPRITIYYVVKKYYSSNEIKTETLKTNGVVTYAKGKVQNSSGAYIDTSNGDVYSINLGKNPSPYQEAYVVNEMSGTFQVTDKNGTQTHDWEWSGNKFIYQESNSVRNNGDGYYDIFSAIDGYKDRIGGEATEVGINVYAWYAQPKIWTSGYQETDYSKTYANLSTDVGTVSPTTVYGDEQAIVSIPQNGNTERVIHVNVYNSSANYDETHTITQDAYVANASWSKPTINGSIEFEIPASGNPVLFIVPVKQIKSLDGKSNTFEWDAPVVKVVGHSVGSSNASFSEGYLSCDSLGKTWFEYGREAFYAERIWVIGKDGEEHEVELNDYIIIRQAKNVMDEEESRYYITSSMDNDGGILPASEYGVRVRATAYKWVKYIWSSGADGEECYEPVPLYVKTNVTSDITTISDSVDGSVTEIYVGANTGNTTREIEVTVYNDSSDINYSETYEITQEAHVQIITWSVPQLNGNIAWEVPASGMAIPFFIPVIQYKYIDGVRQEPGISWHAQATYVSGDVLNDSEAVFSEGKISCETRGINYSNTPREVFRANVIKIEDTNGSEVELKLLSSLIIKQSMNIYETRYGERHLSFTNPTNESWVDSAGATVIVQVACYQESYREYSSLAREPLASVSGIANISSNPIQSELPSTLNDGVETRFWMPENTTSTTKSVQLTATYGSLSDSVTIYQYAASYALSITSLSSINVSAQVGDSGKLIEFKGISTRNGRPFVGSDEVSVSVEGSTQIVYSIGELVFDSETGEFTIPVTIYNNTSVSSRSLTMIVTQSNSDYTERLTITQDAMVATDNIKWGDAYYYSGLQNTMTARLLFKSNVSVIGFYYKINGVVQGDFQNLQLVPQGTQGEWKYMDITRNKQFDYINSTVQFVAEYNSEVEIVTLEYKGGGDIT